MPIPPRGQARQTVQTGNRSATLIRRATLSRRLLMPQERIE